MARYCERCGAQIEEDAVFCSECGASIKEQGDKTEIQKPNTEFVFCANCGSRVSTEFEFCPECGANTKMELGQTMVSGTNSPHKKKNVQWKKAGLIAAILLCVTGVGTLIYNAAIGGRGKKQEKEPDCKVNHVVYMKDNELYISDKDGKSVRLTEDYLGVIREDFENVFESTIEYYDSCEEFCEYFQEELEEAGLKKEYGSFEELQEALWVLYLDNKTSNKDDDELYDILPVDWSSYIATHISLVNSGNQEVVLYSDQLAGNGQSYSLYCRPMNDLEAKPERIASDVKSYSFLGNSCISYLETDDDDDEEDYDESDMKIYNLTKSKIVPSAEPDERQENEIFTENRSDGTTKLKIHKDKRDISIASEVSSFDDTAAGKGIVYFINEDDELYRYNIRKDNAERIADDVVWMSDVFKSGELYYVTRSKSDRYYLCYYNGKETIDLENSKEEILCWIRNGSSWYYRKLSSETENMGTGHACCCIKIDGKVMLAIQDSLVELQEDADGVLFNANSSEIFYISDEGIMHGIIKGKKLAKLSPYVEYGKSSDSSISWYGTIGKDIWYIVRNNNADALYVNNNLIDDDINDIYNIIDGTLYYKKEQSGRNTLFSYNKGKSSYLLDYDNDFTITNTGKIFFLDNFDKKTGTSELYYYDPKGKAVLLDDDVQNLGRIWAY